MELFTTTCIWSDGKLTVFEPSQFVYGMKNGLAEQLGMSPDDIASRKPVPGRGVGSKAHDRSHGAGRARGKAPGSAR